MSESKDKNPAAEAPVSSEPVEPSITAGSVVVSNSPSDKAKVHFQRALKIAVPALLVAVIVGAASVWVYDTIQNRKNVVIGHTTITPKQINTYASAIDKFTASHPDQNFGGSPQQAAQKDLIMNAALKQFAQQHHVTVTQSDIDKYLQSEYKYYHSKQGYEDFLKGEGLLKEVTIRNENIVYQQKLEKFALVQKNLFYVGYIYDTPYFNNSKDPAALRAQAVDQMKSKFLPLFNKDESEAQIASQTDHNYLHIDPNANNDDFEDFVKGMPSVAMGVPTYSPGSNAFNDTEGDKSIPGIVSAASVADGLKKVGQHSGVVTTLSGWIGIMRLEHKTGGTFNSWQDFYNYYRDKYAQNLVSVDSLHSIVAGYAHTAVRPITASYAAVMQVFGFTPVSASCADHQVQFNFVSLNQDNGNSAISGTYIEAHRDAGSANSCQKSGITSATTRNVGDPPNVNWGSAAGWNDDCNGPGYTPGGGGGWDDSGWRFTDPNNFNYVSNSAYDVNGANVGADGHPAWMTGINGHTFEIKLFYHQQTPPVQTVTPNSPNTTTPTCSNTQENVSLPANQNGVGWSPGWTTGLAPGQSVTYTATAQNGYQFPGGAQSKNFSFTNNFNSSSCSPTNTCTNGYTNYPTCGPTNTCTNGYTNYPTCGPVCTNGYSNYPTCGPTNTCTNGYTNYPTCGPVCTNGYSNYPTCGPTGNSLSATFQATCTKLKMYTYNNGSPASGASVYFNINGSSFGPYITGSDGYVGIDWTANPGSNTVGGSFSVPGAGYAEAPQTITCAGPPPVNSGWVCSYGYLIDPADFAALQNYGSLGYQSTASYITFRMYLYSQNSSQPSAPSGTLSISPLSLSGAPSSFTYSSVTSAGGNYWQAEYDFTVNRPISPGDYNFTWSGGGSSGCQATYTEPAPATVPPEPYFQVYGADTLAGYGAETSGTLACSSNANAGIVSWNNGASDYVGAGDQFGAQANAVIQAFVSGAGTGALPGSLTFSNTVGGINRYGGNYGNPAAVCPAYLGGESGALSLPSGTNLATSTWASSLPSGSYVVSGNTTIGNTSGTTTIPAGKHVTLYVKGNVYIANTLTYASSWGTDVADIPSLTIVADGGNILLAPGVAEIDGTFVADPASSGNPTASGIFDTCAPGANHYDVSGSNNPTGSTALASGCPIRFFVRGSVIARQIWLLVSSGDVTNSALQFPAENFLYGPEDWLPAAAAGDTGDTPTGNGYDSIVGLPPAL